MVKPVQKAEINSFIRGFISEASPLNFPADASRDEENFELNRDGSRDRRLGLDFEDNYLLRSTGYNSAAIESVATSSYKWFNAGNDSNNEFAVLQFGTTVTIYDTTKASISRDGLIGSVTLVGPADSVRFSYASVDGTLVIAAGTEEIHVIKYNGVNLTYTRERLLVRDLWGLPGSEGNDITKRPTVRTDAIIYNLQNQGWGTPRRAININVLRDPIDLFYAHYSKYPANSEIVYSGLQFLGGSDPMELLFPKRYDDALGSNIPAAKGYFIIDALKRGTSRIDAFNNNKTIFSDLTQTISSLPADTTTEGASIIADYAGRIFYAGFGGDVVDGDSKSPILSSYILFSQVIKSQDGFTKCYQEGDPTSRETSDIVDTDGGFLRVSGAKKIYGLVPLSNRLFVIADNGVWSVVGGSDFGFTATNYSVTKLSAYGCNNSQSIVIVNDSIFFWGSEGIFNVSKNQYGDWIVQNISEATVQTFYDSLEDSEKRNAIGIYDISDKKIRWMFNQDSNRANSNTVRELIFDNTVRAFSKVRIYALASNSPEVVGYISTASFLSGEVPTNVVVGGINVESVGEQVVMSEVTRTSGIQAIKYVTLYSTVSGNVGYTFSQYKDTTFRDWKSADGVGVDAKGFILTGQVTANDSAIAKQTPYLVFHFRRTEDGVVSVGGELIPARQSSCLIRSQWDWANSIVSGKWSPLFQAYRYRRPLYITSLQDEFDNGHETIVTKNKLRGRGRAMSLYLETESDKDCRILGWNLSITGNSLA